ncbi:MAG TPA: glutamyl-tRNA reductase [Parachlamydiaceae bacterium]|nr:glutamyl-tRNA reductase [Parachlamydiaceae bacterium]
MRVGVLGINHKLASLHLRELLAKLCQRRLHPVQSTHGEHSFVLLSTCNRTEVYFSSEDLAETHSYLLSILRHGVNEEFDQKLYSYFGQDCLLHLCRVTAGLDSAIVAETEIQGQVKCAYESAQECHTLPFELHYLFQKSLNIAKKVRSVLPFKPGLPDLSLAIYQTGTYFFKEKPEPKILLIGASHINEKVLLFLKNKKFSQIDLCNRSQQAGRMMADKHEIGFIEWNNLDTWHQYDWVILGTKSSEFLIQNEGLASLALSHKLVIDLSVPRNADPAIARHPKITLLNIDQINRRLKIRRKSLSNSLQVAEQLVIETINAQMKLFSEKEKNRLRICAISA